ncbi:MAG TPA: hypothetical protein VJJ75_01520 [Candidatus Nanoarchaeia archaeon]|nr:hypothetical protein [Candidatus Nanoarchaeia archaeon]
MKILIVFLAILLVTGGCAIVQETEQKESSNAMTAAGIPIDNADLEQSLEDLTTLEALERADVKDW